MYSYKTDAPPTYRLSKSQKRLLEREARGLSLKKIAEEDGLPAHTVREMALRARRALGAKSNQHAIAIAISRGLIEIEPVDPHEEAKRCLQYLKEYLEKFGP